MNASRKSAAGFTLFELLIAVALIGVLMLILQPAFGAFITASRNNYAEQAKMDNQRVADALVQVAKNEGVGRLPAPYSGGGYTSTVYNRADTSAIGTAFTQALAETGISPAAINDDGNEARNVRVYQRVSGLTQAMPLYFRSGPLVTLTYDYGVVYLTGCAMTSCSNPLAQSGALTAGNRSTWDVVGTDQAPRFVSTLPVQTSMLTSTTRRVDRVRDALISFYRGKQMTATPTDTTNWFPGAGLGGKVPGSNQGCRDGWYRLDNTSVLNLVGLAPEEFGFTSWGGRIEYCRDYDPTASKAEAAPPHAAAVRFHSSVSTGAAPDAAVLANNVILTL